MKAFSLMIKILAGIALSAVLAAAALVATFDADAYRPQIARALSDQLGREVKLAGAIRLGFSLDHGFDLAVNDVSLENPSWASRQPMAKIGLMALGVAWRPLLRKELVVTAFRLKDADILLEKNGVGQENWAFAPLKKEDASQPKMPETAAGDEKASSKPMTFSIGKITIEDSLFGYRGIDRKVSLVKIASLSYAPEGNGMRLLFNGEANNVPAKIDMKADAALDTMLKEKWPFTANIQYAAYDIDLQGTINPPSTEVILNPAQIAIGDSNVVANVSIAYGGLRPFIQGTLTSEKIAPSDFKTEVKAGKSDEAVIEDVGAKAAKDPKRIFSAVPLDLEGLKAADARLEISIGEVPIGPSSVRDIKTKLDIQNGRLLLSPFNMMLAGSKIEGQAGLDAQKSPYGFTAALKAYQLDLVELMRLGGLKSFLEGKGDADMDVTSYGRSLHDFASNLNGQLNLVMAGGTVSESVLREVAGELLSIFAPFTGTLAKPALNCFAGHMKAQNGQLNVLGLLLDTPQATIAGSGNINLRDETMNMSLRAKAKEVKESALVPPIKISGSLAEPSFGPDVAEGLKSAADQYLGGVLGTTGVPDIIQQAGQNACEHTLKNPQAAKPAPVSPTVTKAIDTAKEKAKDLGSKALKGLGGLLGQ